MHENWICWLYQYGVGGVVFFSVIGVSLWLGALRLDRDADRWLLAALVGGYFAWAAAHGLWIAACLSA